MLDPHTGHRPAAAATSPPLFTRRGVLAGGGRGLLALALVGTAASACGPRKPAEPDPLEVQLEAARSDSELATAAARAAGPAFAPALREVAAERTRHAEALVEELARAAGKPTPTSTAETTAPAPASPAPGVADVINALRKSAESATKLVPSLSGYRAGLMGSIAAACTATYTVAIPPPPPPAVPHGRRPS
ncbi:MAG: hypothetical protein ACR2JM_17480 [Mycobacterium sp.]